MGRPIPSIASKTILAYGVRTRGPERSRPLGDRGRRGRCRVALHQPRHPLFPPPRRGRRTQRIMTDVDALEAGVRSGERRMLAKAITLVESTLPDHQEAAQHLLERL